MSVFTTKVNGAKVTVVAANVAFVAELENGKARIVYDTGFSIDTEVGYDSVRKNVAKALSPSVAEDSAE